MLKKVILAGAVAGVLGWTAAHAEEKGGHSHGAAHWGYAGEMGPDHWGGACAAGKAQSPIDITEGKAAANLKPIEFNYKALENAEIVNNGHTVQVNYANGSYAVMEGKKYGLLQFHFHTPSEEAIKGKRSDLVAHLVHKADDGELAVVAVLFNQGESSATLGAVMDGMPREEGMASVKGAINVADLLPKDQHFYHFVGSLTTPPCTEGVQWHVLQAQQQMSAAQLKAFQNVFPMNARPLQPLNERLVEAF